MVRSMTPEVLGTNAVRLHLRARLLPGGRWTDLWIEDGVIAEGPLEGAHTVVSDGWMMPALVDAHLHIGLRGVGGPLEPEALTQDLTQLAQTGISAARILGSPSALPEDPFDSGAVPVLQTAGVPVAAPGRFIPGWGREVAADQLAETCVAEAGLGWSKIIVDWFDGDDDYGPAFPQSALQDAVRAVHNQGLRVAVHTQSAAGALAALAAGVDTLEHGMHLPEEALVSMAERGQVLVPTGTVLENQAEAMNAPEVPVALRRWYNKGLARHPALALRAWEEGVTVLAGTDLPVGALIDEVQWLIRAGVPVQDAIGAASWTAREVLGFAQLCPGERADLIWCSRDPREDVEQLRHPDIVIINGEFVS